MTRHTSTIRAALDLSHISRGIAAVLAIDRLGLWADPAPIPPWEWRKLQRSAARCYLVVPYVNSARSVHLLVLGSLHNSQICANGCEGGM